MQLEKLTNLFLKEIDAAHAFETISKVCSFHRIQASTGFRAAAEWCREQLLSAGIDAQIVKYPADGRVVSQTYQTTREWDMKGGWCEIVSPETWRISDYEVQPMSIFNRSVGCDYRDEPIEVVLLDKDMNESNCDHIDFKGKLVFSHERGAGAAAWTVKKRGAVGIISDGYGDRGKHYDVLQYLGFGWDKGETDDEMYFAFNITPRMGDRLTEMIHSENAAGRKVMARCFIDACIKDGDLDLVEASIPGKSKDELLITAHLCHPAPGANDNASGVAAALEAVCAIKRLIDRGELPQPQRGIRVLLVPEMLGTYEYIRTLGVENMKKFKAAINLDMVAGYGDGYGPLRLTKLPSSLPSFVGDVAAQVFRTVADRYAEMTPNQEVLELPFSVSEFSGGSDHYILSDPSVGVPCPMVGQWPDKFYHTSVDTLEHISPATLKTSSMIAAVYTCLLAVVEAGDIPAIFNEVLRRMVGEMTDYCDRYYAGTLSMRDTKKALEYRREYYDVLCDTFLPFADSDEAKARLAVERARLQAVADDIISSLAPYADAKQEDLPHLDDDRIPTRKFWGPMDDSQHAATIGGCLDVFHAYIKNHRNRLPDCVRYEAMVLYNVNGKRTLSECVERVVLDTFLNETDAPTAYIEFLAACGLIEFREKE